jgi:hypothetical protein
MKMTSGVRKRERQSRALDRLLAPHRDVRTYMTDLDGNPDVKRIAAWTERRDREVATLKQRTGRNFQ